MRKAIQFILILTTLFTLSVPRAVAQEGCSYNESIFSCDFSDLLGEPVNPDSFTPATPVTQNDRGDRQGVDDPPVLAFTGTNPVLPALGLALIGTGFVAIGVRRKIN